MPKCIVTTPKAPEPVGPYSQAVKVGNLLFISGQVPLEPQSGTMVSGNITDQTVRVLENIGAILHAQGLSYRDVVKTTIYLRNLEDFSDVNRVYADYFREGSPARACVEVSNLPAGAGIEIEAIAVCR